MIDLLHFIIISTSNWRNQYLVKRICLCCWMVSVTRLVEVSRKVVILSCEILMHSSKKRSLNACVTFLRTSEFFKWIWNDLQRLWLWFYRVMWLASWESYDGEMWLASCALINYLKCLINDVDLFILHVVCWKCCMYKGMLLRMIVMTEGHYLFT